MYRDKAAPVFGADFPKADRLAPAVRSKRRLADSRVINQDVKPAEITDHLIYGLSDPGQVTNDAWSRRFVTSAVSVR